MSTRIEFDVAPSTGSMMLRAAVSRKPGLKSGEDVGRFEAVMSGVEVTQLTDYQAICGFIDNAVMPLTMPQVIAGPLHMAVLTHPSFPLPAMGLVHVSSRIRAERVLLAHEIMDIVVWVEGQRAARRGVEIDLMTEVRVNGALVWSSVTTCLSMAAKGHGEKRAQPPVPAPDPSRSVVWSIPSDMGRRYGRIAGDRNPIHLWPLTAKLFGFRRHIIHGMWLLARAVAELDTDLGEGPVVVDVAFKRPVFLPATVAFSAGPHGDGIAFRLDKADGSRNHLFGSIRFG
jgi:hypothetical protein